MASFAMSSREIERGICGSTVGAGSMEASQGSAFSAPASRRCTNWRPIFSHSCNIVRAGFLGHGTCIVLSERGGEADMGHNNDASPVPEESRSEEHTSELQSPDHLVCPLLLLKKR